MQRMRTLHQIGKKLRPRLMFGKSGRGLQGHRGQGQGHRNGMKGLVLWYMHVKCERNWSISKEVMANLFVLSQILTFPKATGVKVKVTGVQVMYGMKGLVLRYMHVKYVSN